MSFEKSRKNRIGYHCFYLSAFIFLMILTLTTSVDAADGQKHVLFISSYSESYETIPNQIKGIQSSLDENVIFDVEFMDTKRLDTTENKELFYQILSYKLKNVPQYDAVMVGDDNALKFAMDYQAELFPQTPIVFFAINDLEFGRQAALNPKITGILEKMSLTDTIKIAQSFNPTAKKVVALADSTLTGIGVQEQFKTEQSSFPDLELSILNVSDYTFEEIGRILESLDDDTIPVFLNMNVDKTGTYLDLNSEYAFLKEHTQIPVYTATLGGVGKGMLGGKVIDFEAFGRISGQMIMDILNGKPVEAIDLVEETPYFYSFDYNLIKKYNIDERLIPEGAVLINKDENPLMQYRSALIAIGIIVLCLTLVTFILIIDNIKRRTIQNQLRETNNKLKMTYGELEATEGALRSQYEIVREHAQEVGILNQKFEIAIESTNSAVWEMDLAKNDLMISENFSRIVNAKIKKRENVIELLDKIVAKEYREKLVFELNRYLHGETTEINIQVPIGAEENDKKWILVRGKGILDPASDTKKIHGILVDTTKLKEQDEYIKYLAKHDFLTGLSNRMSFIDKLSEELKAKHRGAVFLFDIDNFKRINDTLGHSCGDELLKEIAARLRTITDENMFMARLGGDEFLVLIMNTTKPAEIETYIKRINSVFENIFLLEGTVNYISISMGISCYPTDSTDINQLLMNADTAMYSIKHDGRNNYAYYHDEMKKEMNRKIIVESMLREALQEDGFELCYQPPVDLKTGIIAGFEALLRMKKYQIGADRFIPIAEETGLIIEMGRWVVEETVRQIVSWREHGLTEKTVAINFSSKQLRDTGYIEHLQKQLKDNQVDSKSIEIEITESILLENNQKTMEFLNQLKKAGIRIVLDDFGTGYSSLNYLTYIPVDKIKLDKSINDKFLNDDNIKVIDSLIMLAHSLNLTITAEGIEDWEQFLILQRGGCDQIQGYVFSRALSPAAAEVIYDYDMIKFNEERVMKRICLES